jgi:hypothetical protein
MDFHPVSLRAGKVVKANPRGTRMHRGALTRIFHKLSGFSRLARVPEEKLDWTALVFRFRQNLGLIPL